MTKVSEYHIFCYKTFTKDMKIFKTKKLIKNNPFFTTKATKIQTEIQITETNTSLGMGFTQS